MLENNKMSSEVLRMICGGNYGDYENDNNRNHSMYQVGQEVELFSSIFHKCTTRRVIIGKKFVGGHWKYKFDVAKSEEGKFHIFTHDSKYEDGWYSADVIQR